MAGGATLRRGDGAGGQAPTARLWVLRVTVMARPQPPHTCEVRHQDDRKGQVRSCGHRAEVTPVCPFSRPFSEPRSPDLTQPGPTRADGSVSSHAFRSRPCGPTPTTSSCQAPRPRLSGCALGPPPMAPHHWGFRPRSAGSSESPLLQSRPHSPTATSPCLSHAHHPGPSPSRPTGPCVLQKRSGSGTQKASVHSRVEQTEACSV